MFYRSVKSVNKKGGRKFTSLSKQAKVALENKRLVPSQKGKPRSNQELNKENNQK